MNKLERLVQRLLGKQAKSVLAILEDMPPEQMIAYLNDPASLEDFRMEFERALRKRLTEIAILGMNKGAEGLNSEIRFDLPHQEAVQWANEHAAELVKLINDNTRALLRDEITKALQQGADPRALRERIAGIMTTSPVYRARRIAETEIMTAYHNGSLEAFKASGVVWGKQWKAAKMGACRICQTLNGQAVPLEENFNVIVDGKQYTLSPGQQAHPHCRCSIRPITRRQAIKDGFISA